MTTESPNSVAPATPIATEVVVRPHRPWFAPAIACAVLGAIILFLLIPGLLIYPQASATGLSPAVAAEANAALEQRAKELRSLLSAGVCKAEGRLKLQKATPGGPTQQDLDNAVPPELAPAAPTPPGQPNDPTAPTQQSSLLDTIDKGVSLILVEKGSGTGFFIAPDLIVTNAHVATGQVGSRVYVVNKTIGKPVEAIIEATSGVGASGTPDFALLRVQGATAPAVLSIAPTPSRTQTVIAAGYPGMILDTDPNYRALMGGDITHLPDATTSSGMVAHVQKPQGTDVVVHSAELAPGNSGGPLLDRCGRVTGVNTFITFQKDIGRGLNFSLASGELAAWLQTKGVSFTSDNSPCRPATNE